MEESRVCFIDIPIEIGKNRSQSPLTPSPRLERNIGFFHALSRRFGGRRSHDDLIYNGEDDSRSSSTDSCSSTTGNLIHHHHHQNRHHNHHNNNNNNINNNNDHQINDKDSQLLHNSNLELSCGSSDTSSTVDDNEKTSVSTSRLHRRSTSSIRRALHSFSISSRSLSCSGTPLKDISITKSSSTSSSSNNQKKTSSSSLSNKKQPQRILRQPVSYTYVKGLSGLPTQRVPRSSCCHSARR